MHCSNFKILQEDLKGFEQFWHSHTFWKPISWLDFKVRHIFIFNLCFAMEARSLFKTGTVVRGKNSKMISQKTGKPLWWPLWLVCKNTSIHWVIVFCNFVFSFSWTALWFFPVYTFWNLAMLWSHSMLKNRVCPPFPSPLVDTVCHDIVVIIMLGGGKGGLAVGLLPNAGLGCLGTKLET